MGLSEAGDSFGAGEGVEEGLGSIIFEGCGEGIEGDGIGGGVDEFILSIGSGIKEDGVFVLAFEVGEEFDGESIFKGVILC